MSYTQRYRDQHEELLKMAGNISTLLKPEIIEVKADEIAKQLNLMTGKLKIHLSTEDEVLYPNLKKINDPGIKSKIEQFSKEMGGIAKAYLEYHSKWTIPANIKAKPNDFIKETQSVFKVLQDRIFLENNDLYSLADKVNQKAS